MHPPRRLVPLLAMAIIVLAGTAWAGTDEASLTASLPLTTVQDGSSQPPSAAARPPQPQPPKQIASGAAAEAPRGGNGGDDRRLFMLMMLGRVGSGGPFGRLGQ
jgi:hypothetical protein